jgi:uncharacterized membrane protein YoaK (UPF0700 family)
MTVVTGLVDAFSYLVLGHVFVANMTGNVVFLGFALAGAPGFSIAASGVALGAFGIGALAGGRLGAYVHRRRDVLLTATAAVEGVLIAVSVGLVGLGPEPPSGGYRYGLIVLLSLAMGLQNAGARTVAVPDFTTTVLTQTITGMAADSTLAGGGGSRTGRRLTAVVAMLIGALIGASLVVHADVVYPVVAALVLVVTVAISSRALGRSRPQWTRGK